MTLRCKEGDLAIIVNDTPPCAANIGRIVQVRGLAHLSNAYGLTCWWIRTISPTPLWVEQAGKLFTEVVDWNSGVEHPDAWLVPLPKLSADKAGDQTASEPVAGRPTVQEAR